MSEHAATRLYVPQALTAGTAVALDTAQSHRLRNVLRLIEGFAADCRTKKVDGQKEFGHTSRVCTAVTGARRR